MKYISVNWKNSDKDLPVRMVSEIGDNGYELRKLEFFENKHFSLSLEGSENLNNRLGDQPVPSVFDINLKEEFSAIEIEKEEFEGLWCIQKRKFDKMWKNNR